MNKLNAQYSEITVRGRGTAELVFVTGQDYARAYMRMPGAKRWRAVSAEDLVLDREGTPAVLLAASIHSVLGQLGAASTDLTGRLAAKLRDDRLLAVVTQNMLADDRVEVSDVVRVELADTLPYRTDPSAVSRRLRQEKSRLEAKKTVQ